MRPVDRGASPISGDFSHYDQAQPYLVSRLGPYCSYCERRIATNLAVEHIEPKGGPHGKPALTGVWTNFLLACVNCNSTKRDRAVDPTQVYFPDRDNTLVAFEYTSDGDVRPHPELAAGQQAIAEATLALVGLDERRRPQTDENGRLVALQRWSQRKQAWAVAEHSRALLTESGRSSEVIEIIGNLAAATGLFSIWMIVFQDDIEMRCRFLHVFKGTSPDCFDWATTAPISPRPAVPELVGSGKI
ncbi:MAG: HNH endonuclease [Armatimonadetes bacterium]|nr:HNH endonuclease [Armatimonadota bacterium]